MNVPGGDKIPASAFKSRYTLSTQLKVDELIAEVFELAKRWEEYRKGDSDFRTASDHKVQLDYEGINTETFCFHRLRGLLDQIDRIEREPDDCVVCEGHQGGVKGNENIVDDLVMCDYCSVAVDAFKKFYHMTRK